MRILAIDPGTEQSAALVYRDGCMERAGIYPNEELVTRICGGRPEHRCGTHCIVGDVLAIEMIASYGMPVGASVFETCVWIGRFIQEFGGPHEMVYRREVKLHLCDSPRAKDGNVRRALIDRFPATGGGKDPQIGIKKKPGPLYGFHDDMWAALGVAITFAERGEGTT